jgi:hypothetical protein
MIKGARMQTSISTIRGSMVILTAGSDPVTFGI